MAKPVLAIQPIKFIIAVAVLCGLGVLAYRPGLSGGFLFDDFINLQALGEYGGIINAERLWLYLTNGIADPTGRPLSMLTFLLDAHDWPAEPASFKRTNLIIHLCNALLLMAVLHTLAIRSGLKNEAFHAAWLGAALWALHPLWVSTTLYVIQRQAMLPASFVLVAVLMWELAWRRLQRNTMASAWLLGLGGVGAATLCAVLSKANGALTPLLVALVWWYIYRPREHELPPRARQTARRLAYWALIIPSVLVVFLLLWKLPQSIEAAANNRDWPLWQRILSQPRALFDYLGLLWIPSTSTSGVYADSFNLSRGLLSPWTTLPAILALGGLLTWILLAGERHRALSLALSFFLVGHLVESGWIALEPYFEHRSYLPALLMFWPLALWLTSRKSSSLKNLRFILALILPLLLTGLTLSRAVIWGNPQALSESMAHKAPNSARALGELSIRMMRAGELHSALQILDRSVKVHPDEPNISLPRLRLACALSDPAPKYLEQASEALKTTPVWTVMHFRWFERAIEDVDETCPILQMDALERLLQAATENPRIRAKRGWLQDIKTLRGFIALEQGDPAGANRKFVSALMMQPNPDVALRNAAALASAGEYQRALDLLTQYRTCCWGMDRPVSGIRRIHKWIKWREEGYYEREFKHLTTVFRKELSKSEDASLLKD